MKTPFWKILVPLALLLAGAGARGEVTGCETVGHVQGVCGFPAPEDIAVLPGGRHLLLSPFGGISGEHPQSLYIFDTETLKAGPVAYRKDDGRWDGGLCDTAPGEKFGAHGVHISERQDGRWQLLAVNHDRESVEMFEIVGAGASEPALAWRGCVVMPAGSTLNDVAALPGGGFLVSHMMARSEGDLMAAMAQTGDTGHIWRWRPGRGVDKLPGSDSNLPNGVAVSDDGRHVYIAETGRRQVRKLDYASGEHLGAASVAADNFTWTPDGRLLTAGITGAMPEGCMTSPGPCLAPFHIAAIDPETMAVTVLHRQNGPPMGAGSVAVLVGDTLYAGSFKGHQLLRINLGEKTD